MFKVGDKVKVMRRSTSDEVYWGYPMDKSIGKVYTILCITSSKNLLLNTNIDSNLRYDFYFPPKGVKAYRKNQQLLFSFME